MDLSTIIEVALGLVLLYYVLSLIVSSMTSEISKWTQMRAKDLELVLRERFRDPETFDKFMNHPLVKNLQPMRLKPIGTGIMDSPVDKIPAHTFSTTLFDILAPQAGEENKLEQIRNTVRGLPDGEIKTSLSSLIDVTVTDIQTARENVEKWYDDIMQNVSRLYTQHARRIAIICALVVTIVVDADSITVANQLWSQPTLQAAAGAKAEAYIREAPDPKEADVSTYIATLEELKIPILWSMPLPQDEQGWLLKILGWVISWVAISQGSSFWYDVLKRVKSAGSTISGRSATT
jgi:hypothetical protein